MIKATNWINNWTFNLLNIISSALSLEMKNQNVTPRRVIVDSAFTNLIVVLLYVKLWPSSSISSFWIATELWLYISILTCAKIMKRSSNSTNILKYLVCPVCAAFGSWFVKNVKVTPSGISTVQGMINDKAVTRNLDTLTTFESSKLLNHAWWKMERYLGKTMCNTWIRLHIAINHEIYLYLKKTVTKIWRKKAQTLP